MLENVRFRLYHVLEPGEGGDAIGRRVDWVIMAMILVNVITVMLETVDWIAASTGAWLHAIEVVSVAVFAVEYAARVWVAPVDHRFRRPIVGRLRYMLTAMAMIDLAAILPFFVMLFVDIDLHTALMLRMFRLMRLFKLARYMESLRLVTGVFRLKRDELTIVLAIDAFMLVLFSSIMYVAEHQAQPDKFGSIPESLWFGVVTMTTVGFGDVTPVTIAGKFAAASLAVIGVAMFALPTGIIVSGFAQQIDRRKRTYSPTCPHCGKDPFVPPEDVVADRLAAECVGGASPAPDVFDQIIDASVHEPPLPRQVADPVDR